MKKNSTKKALLMSVLSLLLCVSMLIGTTYAWFTDTVTSASNIIKSGTLDIEMTWAEGDEDPATATYKDASKDAIFNYELWEPGYTEAKHIAIKNVGTLALKYQMRILANGVVSKLADVIDVYYYENATQLTRDNYATAGVKLGTLSEVLNNNTIDETTDEIVAKPNALSNTITGTLLAGEENSEKKITIALHMQESAGNEYQGLSIGTDFSVQLLATQLTHEEDSFDNKYDANADYAAQEIPSPMVSELSDLDISYTAGIGGAADAMTLDAGYQFQPTETYEQAQQSEYRWHHADFVVSADADVPAESIALAGFYNLWCNGFNDGRWVALTSPEDIVAGEEVRLVHGMGGGSITVAYEELCNYGNDGTGFLCGLKALDAEALAGTTISVELRLYETYPEGECPADHGGHKSKNCETGEYIIAGVTKYTFPAAETADAAELAGALQDGRNVTLTEDVDLPISSLGTQTPGSGQYKLGNENTEELVIDLNGNTLNITTTYWSAIGAKNPDATIIIKNGTVTSSQTSGTWNSYDVGFTDCNYVLENVVFDKAIYLDSNAVLKNVTINETHDYYAMWIPANGQTIEIDGLTINSAGRGIKIDQEYVGAEELGKVTLKVSNATFNTAKKAAILVDSTKGADITLNNVDIANVAADNVNAVWVDADAAAYADLVTVTGGTVITEA